MNPSLPQLHQSKTNRCPGIPLYHLGPLYCPGLKTSVFHFIGLGKNSSPASQESLQCALVAYTPLAKIWVLRGKCRQGPHDQQDAAEDVQCSLLLPSLAEMESRQNAEQGLERLWPARTCWLWGGLWARLMPLLLLPLSPS